MHNIRMLMVYLMLLSCFMSGCALVKPSRDCDEVTPIDWGMAEAFDEGITVVPFKAHDEVWGVYAAGRMKEYLLNHKAFVRVVYADKDLVPTRYILDGEIEHIFYGGTHSPSVVYLTVRIIDTTDGDTRFMRRVRATSEKDAYHVNWMIRVYVPSPYPEELMNDILDRIAGDIASGTRLPAKKCP